MPKTQVAAGSSGHPNWGKVPQTATQGDCCCQDVAEAGMGERFTPASRPGPIQGLALARAVEPCRTQTPTCSLASLA